MVVIDTPMNGWSHLGASTLEELHRFCEQNSIPRRYFHNKSGLPHYDIRRHKVWELEVAGAVKMDRKTFFKFLELNYRSENTP